MIYHLRVTVKEHIFKAVHILTLIMIIGRSKRFLRLSFKATKELE